MATSGDYRNFQEHDGVRYSHTIDPVTGRPVTHDLASVPVLGPDAMQADRDRWREKFPVATAFIERLYAEERFT